VDTVDQSLQATAARTKYSNIENLDALDRQSILFNKLGETGALNTIVADATGHLVYQSGGMFPRNFSVAGRPEFEALRREDIGLVFSPRCEAWLMEPGSRPLPVASTTKTVLSPEPSSGAYRLASFKS
jgi:hypothetical protein